MVFGANQSASLDLSVENNDPDNDIDTITMSIPGSVMQSGDTVWYIPAFIHEWNATFPEEDQIRFQAKDDFPGPAFGGSAQYDIAGNIDDALDHNENIDLSESLTVTVRFTTPTTPGVKTQTDAMDLQVGDLKTEGADPQTSVLPFPYSYLVIDIDYEFLVYEVESEDVDLEIVYGTQTLFSGTRASDFVSSEQGFKFTSEEGTTIAVLEAPGPGTSVRPMIRAKEANLTGTFSLNFYKFRTMSIDPDVPKSEWLEVNYSIENYELPIPSDPLVPLDLDIDGDGLFNGIDDDRDGDGINNDEDISPDDPGIANRNPIINDAWAENSKVREDRKAVLHIDAEDHDGDGLTFIWTMDKDANWTMQGATIEVGDLEPGTYIFTVRADDGAGGEAERTVALTVTEAPEGPSMLWTIILILLILVVIIGIAFMIIFNMTRRKSEEEAGEEPVEIPPQGSPVTVEETAQMETAEPEEIPEMESLIASMETPLDEAVELFEEVPTEEAASQVQTGTGSQVVPPSPGAEQPEPEEVKELEQLLYEMENGDDEAISDVCPECNAKLGPYDTECASCGAVFELALECPNCGAAIEEAAGSCPSCGVAFQ